eukprot:6185037-Pleurochrysis_carterae.AAC.4
MNVNDDAFVIALHNLRRAFSTSSFGTLGTATLVLSAMILQLAARRLQLLLNRCADIACFCIERPAAGRRHAKNLEHYFSREGEKTHKQK